MATGQALPQTHCPIKALTSLARKHGYMNTTTGGYCPTGNSTIESFWQFFGTCIRDLSDADYADARRGLEHHRERLPLLFAVPDHARIRAPDHPR